MPGGCAARYSSPGSSAGGTAGSSRSVMTGPGGAVSRARSGRSAPVSRPPSGVRRARTGGRRSRSEEHRSELQSLMRISYAVFCLKKKKKIKIDFYNNRATTKFRTTIHNASNLSLQLLYIKTLHRQLLHIN